MAGILFALLAGGIAISEGSNPSSILPAVLLLGVFAVLLLDRRR